MRWFLLVTVLFGTGFSSTAVAQQETDRQNQGDVDRPQSQADQGRNATQGGPAEVGRLDEKTKRFTIRASQLIGIEIQNAQGEEIGEVDDLVLDTQTGKIRYAAVSYGGVLGVGDKLFAVPWEAFHAKPGQDGQQYVLMLNVSKQQLENAQGFSEDNWPDFADREFTHQVDKRYGVERDRQDRGVRVDVQRGEGVEVDVNRDDQRRSPDGERPSRER